MVTVCDDLNRREKLRAYLETLMVVANAFIYHSSASLFDDHRVNTATSCVIKEKFYLYLFIRKISKDESYEKLILHFEV